MKFKDLTGKRFGYLTVVWIDGHNKWNQIEWLCRCDCGNTCRTTCGNLSARRGTRSCGCKRSDMVRKKLQLRPYEALYRIVTRQPRHRVEFTFAQFLAFTTITACHYCDAPVVWHPYPKQGKANYNLDRKDNSKEYTVENCVVCCARCNRGKGADFTYAEWVQIGRLVRDMRTA
jgi:hypothetical protein